jgi:hypothetical protein
VWGQKRLLIGSKAIECLYNDYRDTSKSDLDYAVLDEEGKKRLIAISRSPNLEVHIIPPLFNEEVGTIPHSHILLTLKVSHIYWSKKHFDKTIYDIEYLRSKGAIVNENLYKDLYRHWEKEFGKKTISLDKTNTEFFNDKLQRTMDHDDLHRMMAYGPTPVYEGLKKDNSKALIDKELFFALPKAQQLACCREEIIVIALEKWIIPSGGTENHISAWKNSYKHLVTTITKGWFARYLVDNSKDLRKPDYNYKKAFYDKIENKGF